MEKLRKPFQGILNIIRFNWHFYVIAFGLILSILFISNLSPSPVSLLLRLIVGLIVVVIVTSLLVSYYVYDLSGFYQFEWIENCDDEISVVNINAGFDETSVILKNKFKNANFLSLDFYDPKIHTEVSIKRARKRYPAYPNTKKIETTKIDIESNTIDKVFVVLSAHEIRNKEERAHFFSELSRILKIKGQIIVIEHLRDISNFLAYNIGAFHFYSKSSWLDTFDQAELNVKEEIKNTAFISTFILEKNGNSF